MIRKLHDCRRCPRLAKHLRVLSKQYPDYHNRPVGRWGDPRARVLVVGLAPGLHGANATGQAFVGDSSGRTLFQALHAAGLATSPEPSEARLHDVQITNVVKCLPPENRPVASEIANCRPWLVEELDGFLPRRARKARVLVCLGGVAFHATRTALNLPKATFAHGFEEQLGKHTLMASFHPSRQNINTGRLSVEALTAFFRRVTQVVR